MQENRSIPVMDVLIAVLLIAAGVASAMSARHLGKSVLEPIGPGAFPLAGSFLLIALSLLVIWRAVRVGTTKSNVDEFKPRPGMAVLALALTCAYFLVMQLEWLSFRWATVGYVTLLTAALFDWQPRKLPAAIVSGLIMGLGLTYAFTQVLYVDLPS